MWRDFKKCLPISLSFFCIHYEKNIEKYKEMAIHSSLFLYKDPPLYEAWKVCNYHQHVLNYIQKKKKNLSFSSLDCVFHTTSVQMYKKIDCLWSKNQKIFYEVPSWTLDILIYNGQKNGANLNKMGFMK